MPITDNAKNQRITSRLVEREVIQCLSSLVSHFAQNPESLEGSDYSYDDDILPLLECREDASGWTIEECRDFLREHGGDEPEGDDVDDWREKAQESANDNPREVFEHWSVSSFLADKLREQGESVGELFDMHIWGRTTTGQAISMDSVIFQIAGNMEILDGQKNSWGE